MDVLMLIWQVLFKVDLIITYLLINLFLKHLNNFYVIFLILWAKSEEILLRNQPIHEHINHVILMVFLELKILKITFKFHTNLRTTVNHF